MQDFDDDAIDEIDGKTDTDETTAILMPGVIKADALAGPPGMKLVHPFAHYAASEGAEAFFDGDYVKIDQERGWIRGQKKEPIGATEPFVANMPSQTMCRKTTAPSRHLGRRGRRACALASPA